MNDLTEYARAVDQAETIEQAELAMQQLLEQFKYKDKTQLYQKYASIKGSKSKLQKWAWDLVLVGFNEKVI